MYYIWYKIASILITCSKRKLSNIEDEIIMPLRVRLFDCDGMRVMSGFQYPSYMYLSSWLLCTRTNFPKTILSEKWTPVAASQKYICRRPLRLWTPFILKVSFAGWDEKWFYHKHLFMREGELCAIGTTRFAAWRKGKIVPVPDVFRAIGYDFKDNPPPDWVMNQFKEDIDSYNEVASFQTTT